MSTSPDAALFAALVAETPPPPGVEQLVLGLSEDVRAVTAALREAAQLLRAPATGESAHALAALLGEAEAAAQRQAEGTAALLRQLSRNSRAA